MRSSSALKVAMALSGPQPVGDVGCAHERRLPQRLLGREVDVEDDRRHAAGGRHPHQADHEQAPPPAPQGAAAGARAAAAGEQRSAGAGAFLAAERVVGAGRRWVIGDVGAVLRGGDRGASR